MAGAEEKFFFHMHKFDDQVIDELPPEEEEEDLPPPPPVFSEAELEAAKKKAFTDGHAQGVQETESSRAQALATMMQKLADDTNALFKAEAAREKTYEREVLTLCTALFEQVFPEALKQHGFDALIAQIENILQAQHGQKNIHIRVSNDYQQGVSAFMEKLKSKNSELSFKVSGDDTIQDGAFKMDWEDGGAICDLPALAQSILVNLDETLAGKAVPSHNERDKESNSSSEGTPSQDHGVSEDVHDNEANENPIREDDNDG